jgi:hypothetical protein
LNRRSRRGMETAEQPITAPSGQHSGGLIIPPSVAHCMDRNIPPKREANADSKQRGCTCFVSANSAGARSYEATKCRDLLPDFRGHIRELDRQEPSPQRGAHSTDSRFAQHAWIDLPATSRCLSPNETTEDVADHLERARHFNRSMPSPAIVSVISQSPAFGDCLLFILLPAVCPRRSAPV